MTIRIFGTETCDMCRSLRVGLDRIKIPYVFMDANADENQTICDRFFVDSLPHVQLIDDNNIVVWQKAKDVTLFHILNQLKLYETQRSAGTSSESC